METYVEIQRYVKSKKKQGYEGYHDCLEYFRKYTLEELDYFELEVKCDLEACKRKASAIGALPLIVSVLAMFISVFSKMAENDIIILLGGILFIIFILIVVPISYVFATGNDSKLIARKERVLQIIKTIKDEKISIKKNSQGIASQENDMIKREYYVTICEKQQ